MKTFRLIFVLLAVFLIAFPSLAGAQTAQQAEAVPNVTGMKATEAQRMLIQQGWKAGMEYRTVSDPKQDGTVLGTKPPAGTRVSKQQVVILVAGKLTDQSRVPNVTGMPLAEAQKALVANKLNARVIRENTADPGKNQVVLKQLAAPGTSLAPGSTVPVVVGVHTAPAQVKVPYVTGKPLAEAQKILVDNKLNAQVTHQPVAEPHRNGVVIGQKVAVGTPLAPGSMVPVVVGQYTPPAMTPVPSLMGMKADAARQNLEKQGWKVNVQERPVTDAQQSGAVVQQSPPPGTKVQQKNQPVTLYVGKAPERVPVPQVAGMKLQEAQAVLSKARLNAQVSTQPVAEPQRNGVVLGMKVAAGTPVAPGTMVPLVVGEYKAPAAIPLPSVKGMKIDQARQMLEQQGWKIETLRMVQKDASMNNIVLQQAPAAGTQSVPQQTTVRLTVGIYTPQTTGGQVHDNRQQPLNPPIVPDSVLMPDTVGKSLADARQAVGSRGLSANRIVVHERAVSDPKLAGGVVRSQKPAAGASVPYKSSSPIELWVDIYKKPS
jgi:beta-lactam-binding protein with PASTA domain